MRVLNNKSIIVSLPFRAARFGLLSFAVCCGAAGLAKADELGASFESPAVLGQNTGLSRARGSGATAATGRQMHSSALANSLSVVTTGSGNTIILNVQQQNTGSVVSASALNGALRLD